MSNVFITGLTGLVGSGFLYHLVSNKYDTSNFVALCRKTSDTSVVEKYCKIERGSSHDNNRLDEICQKYKFDTLIHISNKAQIVQFAKLAAKHNIKKVIMVSSTYAQSRDIPGNTMIRDENEAAKILEEKGVEYIFIRPTSIFGLRPDGKPDRNIAVFRKYVLKHYFFPLFKKGKASVQHVWGRDVGQAIYISLVNFNQLKNKRLTVSGDKKRTFKELISLIAKLENKKIHFMYFPGWVGFFIFYSLFFLSFGKIDKRESIQRLMEDKAFDTSDEYIKLGYNPHSFEHSYLTMKVFDL